MDRVFELFPILETYEHRNAGLLSGGEQQMVAIGQALMSEPRILMLVEPMAGLSIMVSKSILEALGRDGRVFAILRGTDGPRPVACPKRRAWPAGRPPWGEPTDEGRVCSAT